MGPEQASMARWVEIDLDTIASNVSSVKQLLAPEVKLLAVVKADGYGLGLVQTARVAVAQGAAMLGVTHPGDGVVLREAGDRSACSGLPAAAAGRGRDRSPISSDALDRLSGPGPAPGCRSRSTLLPPRREPLRAVVRRPPGRIPV